jgi:hypothetical protein
LYISNWSNFSDILSGNLIRPKNQILNYAGGDLVRKEDVFIKKRVIDSLIIFMSAISPLA